MVRRRKITMKSLTILLTIIGCVLFLAAFAIAQPETPIGVSTDEQSATTKPPQPLGGPVATTPATRAQQAAAALVDAHPGDRAVAYLAEIAQREMAQAEARSQANSEQIFNSFSGVAEEHLISPTPNPAEAQQLLRNVVQQLRGVSSTTQAPTIPQSLDEEARELTAFGHDLIVEQNMTVEEASVVGGNLTIRGRVLRDAVAVGGNITMYPGARVDGDAVSVGGNVTLSPTTRVEGDTVAIGGRTTIPQGAWVGGDRTQLGTGVLARPLANQRSGGFVEWLGDTVKTIGLGLVMALLCVVIAALMPNRIRTVITTVRRRPMASFFAGILTMVVVVTASFVLAITFIGIPLVPVLWIAVGLAVIFGMTGISAMVGEVMPGRGRTHRSALRCIVFGVAVLTIISLIPFGLGWILLSILLTVALGSVILSRIGAIEPNR